ncbi:MAG TPA: glycoside hydrolase family 2 TIM barrel-domain containing protein, partial [Desulfosarcina sp.]|nr:glycoside hydrolase family 2 TIM barrel-domain containing protein [Desulfosarcina sp.]
DPDYRRRMTDEIQRLLDHHKNHPALLMWALGNEINLAGAGTPQAWRFVDGLARRIKAQDPNHPVISVISFDDVTANAIAAYAPHLDGLGINAYGALSDVRAMIDASAFKGPYLVTEWGVDGHWEAERTLWGRPIEPTSDQKVDYYLQRYAHDIQANSDRCIGSYVFLWGQKQERTPTWYSMFIEQLPGIPAAACATVDAMHYSWSGDWPHNRAPQVMGVTIDDRPAGNGVVLNPEQSFVARVEAVDPENDGLRFVWEMMAEPTVLGVGGSPEPRPPVLQSTVAEDVGELLLKAPASPGEYRLFVYVLDAGSRVGTANIPFRVDPPQHVATEPPVPPAAKG